jgi:Carbohydrate binding module (family 6)
MKIRINDLSYFLACLSILSMTCQKKVADRNAGPAFTDSRYTQGIQLIPGKVQCEYFNRGGEGVAYHDADSINSGSGGLNKASDYLSMFRKDEAVDISFTKFYNGADNSVFNLVDVEENELYVGWTEPGEWIKYTVDVKAPGVYEVGIRYSANGDGQISLSVNDNPISGPLTILSTFNEADTIPWRQWHHWNEIENLVEIQLEEGIQVLTLHTVARGQMNYDFLEFRLKEEN